MSNKRLVPSFEYRIPSPEFLAPCLLSLLFAPQKPFFDNCLTFTYICKGFSSDDDNFHGAGKKIHTVTDIFTELERKFTQ